jgi:apolipoprotein N-acyltransferase
MDDILPDWLCGIVGLSSGILLAIPAIYPAFAPLQLIALMPVFYLGASERAASRGLIIAGLFLSIAYILPQLYVLRLPVSFVAPLVVFGAILMIVEVWGFGKLLAGPGLSGAIAAGALLVVIDWILFMTLPAFGTASSLVRPWSRYPALVQFVSITGLIGINFVIGSVQALAAKLIVNPQIWRRAFISITAIVFVFSTANIVIKFRKPIGQLKVAAVGWTNADIARYGNIKSERGFKTLLGDPIINAAQNGARLIVCPELVFWLPDDSPKKSFEKLADIARSRNVYLAVGFGDKTTNENRMMFIDPNGQVIGEYTKTYLAYFEHFKKGDGRLTQINIDGFPTGAMICADDGNTQLSREYGRRKVPVVAVLNNDWFEIKNFHLQTSIHRAIESRYAVVRAASNGISAIISPDGKVLAIKDHFRDGPGFVIAETPLYSGGSLFSHLGHWPVVPSVIFLVVYIGFRFKRACFENH